MCHGTDRGTRLGLVWIALLLFGLSGPLSAATWYVKWDATGGVSGLTWADAFTDLQAALTAAAANDEIWVAKGTYKPVVPGDPLNPTLPERQTSFQLKDGVALFGGFAGGETARAERNWVANETMLSGDLDANGAANSGDCYHVVTGAQAGSLDGFTITFGFADGAGAASLGAGMYNTVTTGQPGVANCVLVSNFAANAGGAMYNNQCTPAVTNCTFRLNTGGNGAGAMYNVNCTSTLALANCAFVSNSAGVGDGGAIYNAGSSPRITNCAFSTNAAVNGGALCNEGTSNPEIWNCSFSGNSATANGKAMYNLNGSPTITNCVLWDVSAGIEIANAGSATPVIAYCDVRGAGASGTNIDSDPLFIHAGVANLRLRAGSPCINTGTNTGAPANDKDGNLRPYEARCDMGAYEWQGFSPPYIIRVKPNGVGDGFSWPQAAGRLGATIFDAPADTEIWVAVATYLPLRDATGNEFPADNRTKTFQLRDRVTVFGGFAGTEGNRAQRDFALNVTVLSGDIGLLGNNADNSYHVATGASGAVLDGFTVRDGRANGTGANDNGAGMYNDGCNGALVVANCAFTNNSAAVTGGGIYNTASSPKVDKSTFSANVAVNGGGMANENGSAPAVTACTFQSNTLAGGSSGGGIYNNASNPLVSACSFISNSATNGGGMFNTAGVPAVVNCVFRANAATNGGGMHNNASAPTLTNCTFSGNTSGKALYNIADSDPRIRNCILWGDTGGEITNADAGISVPIIIASLILGCGGSGASWVPAFGEDWGYNKAVNPLFVSGADLRLQLGSPAIDAADIAFMPPKDILDVPRPSGAGPDMGAYERLIAVVTLGDLSHVFDTTQKSATATTTPADKTVNLTYNGSATPPTNAGNYTVVGTVSDPDYVGTATATMVIAKAPATVTLASLSQTYNGNPRPATYTTVPPGPTVVLTYDGLPVPPIDAGSYAVVATVADPNYQGGASDALVITKADATVTLDGLTHTYDGNPKAATVTTNPPDLPFAVKYDGSPTVPANAGSYAVVATVTDPNYQGTASGTLTISRANATVTLAGLSPVYDGTQKPVTATTAPPDLPVLTTYDGSPVPPTNAGSYAVAVTVTDPNYQGGASGTLTIAKAPATVTLDNLSRTYDGQPKQATAATDPAGKTVVLTYEGSATPPTDAGSYAVVGTVNDANYQGSASGTLTIAKANALVILSDLTHTYDGTPKSATATTYPPGLKVVLTYNATLNPPANPGSYLVVGLVDELNYQGYNGDTLTITQPNRAPSATAGGSPTSGGVPLEVSFAGGGTDADNDTLSYSWNFGDGSPASAAQNPTHTFAAAGTYNVVLTVSDGQGGSSTAGVTVTVTAAGGTFPGDTDSDGDGFYDEMETALGSNPASAADTPQGIAKPEKIGRLSVAKLGIKLNFAKLNSDAIALSGVLLIPDGFQVTSQHGGQKVIVDIGGVVKSFELGPKGASPKGNEVFAVSVKASKGQVLLQVSKFSVKLSKASYAAALANHGLVNATTTTQVSVPVTVIFNGETLQKAVPLTYKATSGKAGAAK